MAVSEREGIPSAGRDMGLVLSHHRGNPRLSSHPKPPLLSKSPSRWDGAKEKLMAKVVWGRTSCVKRKGQSEGSASLEGGVRSSVEFYNF